MSEIRYLVPHWGQKWQVGLPDMGSWCTPKLALPLNHHTRTAGSADEPRLISYHPAPAQPTQHCLYPWGHTLSQDQSLGQGLFRLCCTPSDRKITEPSPTLQPQHGLTCLLLLTSCLSGGINPRSQGDKVGIIIKAAHEPCPYQTSAFLWPVETPRSCEEP